uniref:RDD domain-containing protein n=1 Tax=Lotharella globosa TaxID=91324 RepID=A0A7S4DZF9_9EUKA|mmetsp:Transcript_2267/g.4497  ORF Transcript_2267/g.4497 Transcript_2267/m.4497 type:complete len:179 (+) Transcript_2267:60-596(+)|eukprot:CAMPEP_0167777166 /NCGR_PEP_ID=MMETSP0111_2-20121227/3536_1 /TAXON_ID=91324 /ORGANISM="Lotharella globosa, Strain CCCM811" /LENGTH=178 /DNA_ID=CAMNT_0007667307 /DNA_START=19 /DNA_END=555 /DNA_ORIENTATION=+
MTHAALRPAAIPARAAAKFVDVIMKTALSMAVGGVFSVKGLVLATAYEVVIPIIWQGQTIGKKVMNIRFRRVDGKPIGLGTTLTRNIGDWLFHFLGYFAAAASNRSIADRMAGTEVVFDDNDTNKRTRNERGDKDKKQEGGANTQRNLLLSRRNVVNLRQQQQGKNGLRASLHLRSSL